MRLQNRKATVSVVMSAFPSIWLSVPPSVCPSVFMERFGSHWTDFYEILYMNIFPKSFDKM